MGPFAKSLLLLAALCRIGGGVATVQDVLEHGSINPTTVADKLGADCSALSADGRVSHSTVIDRQCYFSTTNTSLSWHSAWHECSDIWTGAKLAWFDEPHGDKVDALKAAGFTGAHRIALIEPDGEAERFVYEAALPDTSADYTDVSKLCTASVTGKSSQYHDGSCYVYYDEGQYPDNWKRIADQCTGHVPGYVGHLAWPLSTELIDVFKTLVGGKHSDRLYWTGARAEMPWSGTSGWHLWWNSTSSEPMNGELAGDRIAWGSGQPNEGTDEHCAACFMYDDGRSAKIRDEHDDCDEDSRRHDGICEYREPAAAPDAFQAVRYSSGAIKGVNVLKQEPRADLQQCARMCHELGVDRCRCFSYNPSTTNCRAITTPCSRSDLMNTGASDPSLYTLQYDEPQGITVVLNVTSGATAKTKATAAHSAICIKDAPRLATYNKNSVQPASNASNAAITMSTLTDSIYAHNLPGGPQCAWMCLTTSGCVSFELDTGAQSCTLYNTAANNTDLSTANTYVKHVKDEV